MNVRSLSTNLAFKGTLKLDIPEDKKEIAKEVIRGQDKVSLTKIIKGYTLLKFDAEALPKDDQVILSINPEKAHVEDRSPYGIKEKLLSLIGKFDSKLTYGDSLNIDSKVILGEESKELGVKQKGAWYEKRNSDGKVISGHMRCGLDQIVWQKKANLALIHLRDSYKELIDRYKNSPLDLSPMISDLNIKHQKCLNHTSLPLNVPYYNKEEIESMTQEELANKIISDLVDKNIEKQENS